MKSDAPAFQFYASDFLIGVMGMSDEEIGVYIRLLSLQWVKGGLPSNPFELRKLIGSRKPPSDAVLAKFSIGEDGLLRNARLEQERAKQAAFRASRSENAAKRWQSTSNARASTVHNGSNALQSSSSSSVLSPKGDRGVSLSLKRQAPVQKDITDADWMIGLKQDIAYRHIDIDAEFSKWQRWCIRRHKKPTQARFEAWLNRIEKPLELNGNSSTPPPKGENVW